MRIIFAFVFLIGIGIAGFAAYMAMQQFEALQAENRVLRERASQVVETVPVMMATRELRYGQRLERGDAQPALFPKELVPENAFTSAEALFGEADTPQRRIIRTMEPGEIVMASKVTDFGQDAGVASRLAPGTRAFTINVDVTTGVAGFLQPGDRVDVYWSGQVNGQPTTRLLLQDIELIAIDQVTDADVNRPVVARTVTVQVSPVVVATLTQAQASGRLALSLRGAEESEILGPLEVSQRDLLGIEEVVEEEQKRCFSRVRRGLEVQVIEVDCPTQ
ncbi:Flp pilus assembly protein CpaB [Halovulum dunhuangense]|uniref:Flp pilus assembly protein CpaB n=1 Tax=Halovulum dunhuangense TaxID=1505036 RepID=A0A849L521_9RHOB|nr:Flp pilus assembly protein CpaB [Halovulum dunhuangense]NNU81241.1 Flp pilus assembly protein CpaB [Halovulum dunhuangense]